MLNASAFLGEPPETVESSPGLLDDAVTYERVDATLYGEAVRSALSFIVDDDGRIGTVHLYAHGHQGFDGYAGALPSGIRFDMSRSQVRAVLGSPEKSSERTSTTGRVHQSWDRFDLEGAFLHLEYERDLRSIRSIRLITLMTPSAVP